MGRSLLRFLPLPCSLPGLPRRHLTHVLRRQRVARSQEAVRDDQAGAERRWAPGALRPATLGPGAVCSRAAAEPAQSCSSALGVVVSPRFATAHPAVRRVQPSRCAALACPSRRLAPPSRLWLTSTSTGWSRCLWGTAWAQSSTRGHTWRTTGGTAGGPLRRRGLLPACCLQCCLLQPRRLFLPAGSASLHPLPPLEAPHTRRRHSTALLQEQ